MPRSGLVRRFADAVPPPLTVLLGSSAWGLLYGAGCLGGLYLRNELITVPRLAVSLLFVLGAAAGFAPGLMLARLLARAAGPGLRFAIGTVILGLATHTAIAAVFALQYRRFYAHWHADFPSVPWAYQFTFTSAGAVYQFTVDSLYIYSPFVILLLPAAGIWFARRAH